MKRAWNATHYGPNVHVIQTEAASSTGWEQWILLRADAHTDSSKCRRDIEEEHLQQAVDRDAIIIDLGDALDLMQGVGDRRQCKAHLRSSQLAAAYFDQVIEETAQRYQKYASHWAVLAQGNHESAWLKHHETCPTANLVRAIKMLNRESPIGAGGYGGWVKIQASIGSHRFAWTLRYAHGSGGGAMMTFGTLDTRRMFSWIEGADMIATSHVHDSNIVGIAREYLESRNGVYEVRTKHCDFVRVGTYKDDWGPSGWAVEKGGGPKPVRAKWVRLFLRFDANTGKDRKNRGGHPRICWDVMDAQ